MSLQDIFSRSRGDRPRRPRTLAAIDRALTVETPRLASMFAVFNELAAGEPVGAERLPARARARPAQVVFFAALAAIVALCVALSTQLHSMMRPCVASVASAATSKATSTASPAAASTIAPSVTSIGPPAGSSTGPAVFVPLRGLDCLAYASTNK